MTTKLPKSDEVKHLEMRAQQLWSQLTPRGRRLLDQFVDSNIGLNTLFESVCQEDLDELRRFTVVDKRELQRHQDKQWMWMIKSDRFKKSRYWKETGEKLAASADLVLRQLGDKHRGKKLTVEQKAQLVSDRVTKGWVFTEQTAQSHRMDEMFIKHYVTEKLNNEN